jgi:hypothetical protein
MALAAVIQRNTKVNKKPADPHITWLIKMEFVLQGTYTWWGWSAPLNTSPGTTNKNHTDPSGQNQTMGNTQRKRYLTMVAAGEGTSMRR